MKKNAVVVILALALGAGVIALTRAIGPRAPGHDATRLADVLADAIASGGSEAAAAQYRSLRERGFPGVRESESDTNGLGYTLLGQERYAAAIEVFRLNVESHPRSANAYDSLAEAYLAAGDDALAIESYRKALALDPRMKSARAELGRLTHEPRQPYPAVVLLHIAGGTLGLLSGAAALVLRKGSRRHALAGRVFVVSMLCMSASGAYRALVAPEWEPINVLMGSLTFYLVATAWLTARRRTPGTGALDWAALLAAAALAAGLIGLGVSGMRFAVVGYVFGGVALIGAVGDLRVILLGGIAGAERIARHVWRVCTALYIAAMSLFLGQSQVFPYAVRKTGLLPMPGLLIVALMVFWLIRVLFTKAYRGAAAPKAKLVVGPAVIEEGLRA